VVAKNQQVELLDENLDSEKMLRICFENYYWTTIESYYDIYTDTVQHQYVHHIAQYSYLCGDSGPRSTTINGNPADYGL
jgi:hypothetical protein